MKYRKYFINLIGKMGQIPLFRCRLCILGQPPSYSFKVILTGSAWREAARRATSGLAESISREYNTDDGRFSPRPEGASQKCHCGVAVLEKGQPFPADSIFHCRF